MAKIIAGKGNRDGIKDWSLEVPIKEPPVLGWLPLFEYPKVWSELLRLGDAETCLV
jgi:hypothetical protein